MSEDPIFNLSLEESQLELDYKDFSIDNIPFGMFKRHSHDLKHPCTRIGNYVIRLDRLEELGYFDNIARCKDKGKLFIGEQTLNNFIASGKACWTEIRKSLQHIFANPQGFPKDRSLKYHFKEV